MSSAGGHRRSTGVVLADKPGKHLVVARARVGLQEEDVASDQAAAADDEELHGGLAAVARKAQHVLLGPREGRHLLVFHRPFDRAHLVAQGRRPLVVGALRGRLHLAPQATRDGFLAALQEELTCAMSAR